MKMQACASRAAVTLAVVAILGGCSKSSIPTAPPAGPAADGSASISEARRGGKQKVEMRIRVPRAPKHARGKALRPYFVASSTAGVKIVVYKNGVPHTTPLATTAVGLTSSNCSPVSGGRMCTINAASPVGTDDFEVTTYDHAPSGGSFGSAKQLAVGSATLKVVQSVANVIHLTLGGVVAKGVVGLTTAGIHAINNNSQTVTISAQDADGNALVTDGWFSASGDPVTMSLDTTVGPSVASSFKFTPSTVSFASPTSVMAYTASGASSTQIQNGFTGVVWANPSNGGTSGAADLTVAKPAFTEFPIATSSSFSEGITVGPDNASLWFAESNGNAIGTIAMNAAAGTTTTDYTGLSSFATPTTLASAGGKIWFTEFGIGKIGSINPSTHAVNEYKTPSCGMTCTTPDNPYGIVHGPDGNLWFTENCTTNSKVGTFGASLPSAMVEYATKTPGGAPESITVGPDNNLWFTEPGGGSLNMIGTMTTAGVANDFAVLPTTTIYDGGIAAGSDGALWFGESNPPGNAIGRITTAGSVTGQYGLATAASEPMGVAEGPDGAIWFAENGNNAIGRIDPTTHAVVEFSLPHTNSGPWGIVLAPDGALWFTECTPSTGNRIGRLQ